MIQKIARANRLLDATMNTNDLQTRTMNHKMDRNKIPMSRQAVKVEWGDRLCDSGWTNLLARINNEDRLRAWIFPRSRVAWSNASSPFVLCKLTIRSDLANRSRELQKVRIDQSCSTIVAVQVTAIGIDWRFTHAPPVFHLSTKTVNSRYTLSTVLTINTHSWTTSFSLNVRFFPFSSYDEDIVVFPKFCDNRSY